MRPLVLKLARMNLGDFSEYMLLKGEAYAPARCEAGTGRKAAQIFWRQKLKFCGDFSEKVVIFDRNAHAKKEPRHEEKAWI